MKVAFNLKKNILKIFILIFCVALFLTGCATVSDVKDKNGNNIYFDEITYFQGQIAIVGDYLYYGNSYTASDAENFDYDSAEETGYLGRLNLSNISYSTKEDEDGYVNPSPIGTEWVNGRFVGFQNQYMFALGEYLYFTSANAHSTSSGEIDYTQISLFRIKFNGDSFEELNGTSVFRFDENSILTAQKGSDGNNYIILYVPADEDSSSYNLYSIRIGNSIGSVQTLAENITSVAICDKDSMVKNIIFTTESENENYDTTAVKSVDFATGVVSENNLEVHGSETILQGRIGDVVIYYYQSQDIRGIFYNDLSKENNNLFNGGKEFYITSSSDDTISQINKVDNGYIFISDRNGSLIYKPTLSLVENGTNSTPVKILESSEISDILFVNGDYVYYSYETDNSICRVSVKDKQKETIVTMSSLISGQCGFDGNYIYYYAQLENNSDESEESDTEITDTNYYLYRVDTTGTGQPQLLSKVEK